MEHEKILNLLIKAGFLKEEDAKKVLREKKEDEDIFQTELFPEHPRRYGRETLTISRFPPTS